MLNTIFFIFAVNFARNGLYNDVDNQGVRWTTDPAVYGSEPCKKRGVLSLTPPSWALSAEIALTFAKEGTGWIFNLGDSRYNNGYGKKSV